MTEARKEEPQKGRFDRFRRHSKPGEPTVLPTGYVPEVRETGFEPKPLAEPAIANTPLSPVSRSAAENLSNMAAEARANIIPNTGALDSSAVDGVYEPSTGFRHRRVSGRAVGIAAGLIATAGVAGTLAYSALNQDSDKAIVADVGDLGSPTPPSLTTPDEQQVVIPGASKTAEPTSTPTVAATEPPKPTATPTKEAVAEVPCLIVPEQYCAQAERVIWNNQGKDYTYIGLKVPAGTELRAPRDGLLLKTEANGQPFLGFYGQIRATDNKSGVLIFGGIHFDNMLNQEVSTGNHIGIIDNTEIKNLGAYNLLITINNAGPNGPTTDEDTLRKLFPDAFNKPVANNVTQNGPSSFGTLKFYIN